jgi:hypothetical protein
LPLCEPSRRGTGQGDTSPCGRVVGQRAVCGPARSSAGSAVVTAGMCAGRSHITADFGRANASERARTRRLATYTAGACGGSLKDRVGLSLAVGSEGMCAGVSEAALWTSQSLRRPHSSTAPRPLCTPRAPWTRPGPGGVPCVTWETVPAPGALTVRAGAGRSSGWRTDVGQGDGSPCGGRGEERRGHPSHTGGGGLTGRVTPRGRTVRGE